MGHGEVFILSKVRVESSHECGYGLDYQKEHSVDQGEGEGCLLISHGWIKWLFEGAAYMGSR